MTDLKTLEDKIKELEERVKRLENKLVMSEDVQEKEWMDALYKKAEELVVKHNKASVIFLQKKLIIDYPRAEKLLDKLRANGVVGKDGR